MPTEVISALILGGGSIADGALAGRGRNTTSTQQTVLTPEQQQVSNNLSTKLRDNLNRPPRRPNTTIRRNQTRTAVNTVTDNEPVEISMKG